MFGTSNSKDGKTKSCSSSSLWSWAAPEPKAAMTSKAEPKASTSDILIEVCLLSGRSCEIALVPTARLMDLMRKAREALKVDISGSPFWIAEDFFFF